MKDGDRYKRDHPIYRAHLITYILDAAYDAVYTGHVMDLRGGSVFWGSDFFNAIFSFSNIIDKYIVLNIIYIQKHLILFYMVLSVYVILWGFHDSIIPPFLFYFYYSPESRCVKQKITNVCCHQ